MRQVTSWSDFVVLSVLRNGHKFLTFCDEIVLIISIVICCFLSLVLFVVQRSFFLTHDISFLCQIFHAHLLFTGLDDVLSRFEQVEQRPSCAVPRLGDTSDTSGDESNMSERRRGLRSNRTYKMKKAWGVSDVGQFFVTGPTDVACDKTQSFLLPNLSQGRVCAASCSQRNFPAFPRQQTLPRDQRLRLETPN